MIFIRGIESSVNDSGRTNALRGTKCLCDQTKRKIKILFLTYKII